jgi:hypothetical protein
MGTSSFDCNWESFTLMADVADFLVLLSASSEDFRIHLVCSRNSSLDGGAVMLVLSVFPLAVLCLRSAVKSCSTSVCSCFPLSGRWRFLLVSAMLTPFLTLSPTVVVAVA